MCAEREPELSAEALLEDTTFRDRLEHFAEEVDRNPEFSRRVMLGIGITATLEAGVAAATIKAHRAEEGRKTIAAGIRYLRTRETSTPSSSTTPPPTTTTTTSSPPTTEAPAPPEPEYQAAAVDMDKLNPDQKMDRIRTMIGAIPGLQELNVQKPHVEFFQDIPGKLAHINRLSAESDVSVEEYHHTVVNESRVGAFTGPERIQPRLTVVHWTGQFYKGGIDHMIQAMNAKGVNYHGAVDQITNGKTQMYRFFHEDFPRQGAHAFRANQLGRGYAITAGRIEDIHPLQLKEIIKTVVRDHRRDNLPIDHTTVVSHFAVDLILDNPGFNPAARNAPTYGKYDIPQEAINIIIEKAQALDVAVGPR